MNKKVQRNEFIYQVDTKLRFTQEEGASIDGMEQENEVQPPPISEVEAKINELLSKGSSTSAELLAVEYGEWPPKGLEVDHQNDIPIVFHPFRDEWNYGLLGYMQERYELAFDVGNTPEDEQYMESKFEDLRSAKSIKSSHVDDQAVYYNTASIPIFNDIVGTIGHEGLHCLHSKLATLDWFLKPEDNRIDTLHENKWMAQGKEMDDFIALGETPQQTEKRHEHFKNLLFGSSSDGYGDDDEYGQEQERMTKMDYLTRAAEFLSRMHTIMATGYRDWKEMPQNRVELAAVFSNMGFKMPPSIQEQLDTDEGKAALEKFKWSDPQACHFEKSDFQAILNEIRVGGATNEQKEAFWNNVVPNMYGTLIEMYGDDQGLKKFGYEAGPNESRRALAQMINETESGNALTAERWNELIKDVEEGYATSLTAAALKSQNDNALHALLDHRGTEIVDNHVSWLQGEGIKGFAVNESQVALLETVEKLVHQGVEYKTAEFDSYLKMMDSQEHNVEAWISAAASMDSKYVAVLAEVAQEHGQVDAFEALRAVHSETVALDWEGLASKLPVQTTEPVAANIEPEEVNDISMEHAVEFHLAESRKLEMISLFSEPGREIDRDIGQGI